ncbi:MAG: hypothetical protein KDB03_13395 [Planctomycetales bacterium]|nr:hypothetical protein [Planctomycetales bacterium]
MNSSNSSSAEPPLPWVHIGDCPICVNGLARVRCCTDPQHGQHLFAMCDECEALWITPATDGDIKFADPVDPKCPICGSDLYGPQSNWCRPIDLHDTEWSLAAIIDIPDDSQGKRSHVGECPREAIKSREDELTIDDLPCVLDAPNDPTLDRPQAGIPGTRETNEFEFGQESPEPGC